MVNMGVGSPWFRNVDTLYRRVPLESKAGGLIPDIPPGRIATQFPFAYPIPGGLMTKSDRDAVYSNN